jgi:methanethiol S-methyltransferase
MPKNFSANSLRPFRDRDVVWYTPLLPIVGGGFVFLMIFLSGYLDNLFSLPSGFIAYPLARKGVGSLIALIGLIFFTLGMGRSLLFMRKKRGKKFMITGVFKYSRNPSSFGMMSALFGVSLIMNSLGMFLIALVMLVFFTTTVHFADRLMIEQYGEEFLRYKTSTPRFIPNFNRLICNIFGLD